MNMKVKKTQWIYGIITAIITLVAVISIFGLWNTDIHVPISCYRHDSIGMLLETKNVLRDGTIHNKVIYGAPNINVQEYTSGMTDFILVIPVSAFLGKIFGSVEAGINVHAILAYIALALCMYIVCCKLGVKEKIAMLVGVMYALLPYFILGGNTLLLAFIVCFYIPLFGYCVIRLMSDSMGRYRVSDMVFLIFTMLCVGLYFAYYAFFALIIWAFASVYAFVRAKNTEKFFVSVTGFAAIAFGIVTYIAPDILYQIGLGGLWSTGWYYPIVLLTGLVLIGFGILFKRKVYPHITLKAIYIFLIGLLILGGCAYLILMKYTSYIGEYEGRTLYAVELGSLDLIYISMPTVNAILNVNEPITNFIRMENDMLSMMGILSGIGYVYSIMHIFAYCSVKEKGSEDILKVCGMCNAFFGILTIKGGLGSLIAVFVTTGIRNYNRMVVYIAVFSLIAFAILMERMIERIRKVNAKWARRIWYLGAGALLGIMILLSIPSDFIYSENCGLVDYPQRKAEHDEWYDLIERIEEVAPDGGMILELPVSIEFEYFAELMTAGRAYELAIPAVIAKDTVWSYAGGWKTSVGIEENVEEYIQVVEEAGFCGIYLDMLLYSDDSYEQEIALLKEYLGEPIVCASERRYYFNLRN